MTFQVSKTGGMEVNVCPTLDCRCYNGAMQCQTALAIMEKAQ